MAAPQLPPPPYKSPMMDQNGFLVFAWSTWFRQIFSRLGGQNAPSNSDINTSLALIEGQISSLQKQIDGLNQEPVA